MPVRFEVNGKPVEVEVEPRLTLVDCLRHHLRLTGTHVGCEHGVCGACTVLVDGAAVRACLMLAVQAEGSKVVTVEGLSLDEGLTPLQASLPQAPRIAMRVLHARHDHHRARAAERRARTATPTACARCSPAISAAAPATSRSSKPCLTRGRRTKTAAAASDEKHLHRHADGAPGGPALPARPRRVCR